MSDASGPGIQTTPRANLRVLCWLVAIASAAYMAWTGVRQSVVCDHAYGYFRDAGVGLPLLTEYVLAMRAAILPLGVLLALATVIKEFILGDPLVRLGSTFGLMVLAIGVASVVDTAVFLPFFPIVESLK